MSYEIDVDYKEMFLLPPSVEEWVPENHPARFIRDFVDRLDLRKLGFKARRVGKGRPSFAKSLLLKIWLYGYFERVRTSRRLERQCRDHMPLIWLSGRQTPDHNTLWRFFRENRKPLAELHKQTIELALRMDMVGVVLHAVDGTKIGANSSIRGCLKRGELEKALSHLEEHVEHLLKEIEEEEVQDLDVSDEIPADLVDATVRAEKMRETLAEMEEINRRDLHPAEKEARVIGRKRDFGYNAQAVVDSDGGLIVAQDVVNEETDHNQLVSMIEQVEENLGHIAEETVADGGYASEAELAKAEDNNYPVIVNLPKSRRKGEADKLSAHRFRYDSDRNVVHCPEQPEELQFESIKRRKSGEISVYRCRNKQCPLIAMCTRDKKGRSIEVGRHRGAMDRQREKQLDPQVRRYLRRRAQTVERVFGDIKEGQGFRRFTMRGLEAIRAQWGMITSTFNLRSLYKHWVGGRGVLVGI